MRVLVAKDRKVIPGQEDNFKKVVAKCKQELMDADVWLRENIPSYSEEIDRVPPDWDKEAVEELFSFAADIGDGTIYWDDSE